MIGNADAHCRWHVALRIRDAWPPLSWFCSIDSKGPRGRGNNHNGRPLPIRPPRQPDDAQRNRPQNPNEKQKHGWRISGDLENDMEWVPAEVGGQVRTVRDVMTRTSNASASGMHLPLNRPPREPLAAAERAWTPNSYLEKDDSGHTSDKRDEPSVRWSLVCGASKQLTGCFALFIHSVGIALHRIISPTERTSAEPASF